MPKLAIHRAGVFERELDLDGRDLRIGRADQNDVVLLDSTKAVSRLHAELRFENGHYVLSDMNSENGIWVANHRQPKIVLEPNDPVTIGPYTLTLLDTPYAAAETLVEAASTVGVVAPPVRDRMHTSTGDQAQSAPTRSIPRPSPPARSTSPTRVPKWAVLGALAAVVVVVIVAIGLVRREGPVEPPVAVKIDPPQEPPVAPSDPRPGDELKKRLENARVLDGEKKFDEALEELRQARAIDANNVEVEELQKKIETEIAKVPPPPPPVKDGGRGRTAVPPPPPPPDLWAARYESARVLVERGSAQDAFRAFCEIDPAYRDSRDRTEGLGNRIRMVARSAIEEGDKLERLDDLMGAKAQFDIAIAQGRVLQACQRAALQADSSLAASANSALARVRDRMKTEGEEAFRSARQFYSLGRYQQALPLYERAYKYLPDDDPRKKDAKDRLDEVGRK